MSKSYDMSALENKIAQWKEDFYLAASEILGVISYEDRHLHPNKKFLTLQQKNVLNDISKLITALRRKEAGLKLSKEENALCSKRGLSIKSGRGSGKTTVMAIVLILFLVLFKECLVPCIATKMDQVKNVLFREVSKWISHAEKNGKYGVLITESLTVQGEKILHNGAKNKGKEWYAMALSAGGGADAPSESMGGLHNRFMLIIADEATGISNNFLETLDQTMTDTVNLMIMTYNPTRTSGFAYDSQFKDKQDWICHRFNCEESENVSKESIERVARKYGRDSNAYRISVLGLEPTGDVESVIPLEWVLKAVNRDIEPMDDDPVISCLDVARQGGDKSVIITRQGGLVFTDIREFSSQDTMELTGMASEFISDERPTMFGIDVIGLGYAVYDRLREIGHKPRAVNVSESTSRIDRFERLRDELWWKAREAFESGTISIPDDEELIFELSNVKYKIESNGKIKIESKKEMKKRGVASPNKADALVLTFHFKDSNYRNKVTQDRDYYDTIDNSRGNNIRSWMGV
jgi:phage terminase large subunit